MSIILKEALKLLRSSLPTTIEIHESIKSESDSVLADLTQIHQIVMNLCTNAAHAMREKGGILEVSLFDEYLDSRDLNPFHDISAGSYLRLTVKDTGHGIDSEVINKIFDPYFTTKKIGEGTGMGLAVVHGIVKSYGGDITVESKIGEGTTFHVLIPNIDTEISTDTEPVDELPRGTERVLFVDDEKAAVDAIQPMLKSLGYEVQVRTSSIEALEAFRNNPQSFDLVITDQTMPNMTGDILAKELMKIRPDIPIIICTGFSERIDEHTAKKMGIRSFTMKPLVMGELAVTIRKVLDEK